MPSLPRFDTPVRLMLHRRGAASEVGVQRRGAIRARLVKAFDTTTYSAVPQPSASPPDSQTASPSGFDVDGWKAWWIDRIDDPPKIDRPALPTPEAPILWEASAPLGGGIWEMSIGAFFARVHWKSRTGTEALTGDVELVESLALAKMRPGIIRRAAVTPKEWCLVKMDDGSIWDIENIVDSFRRGEFVELVLRRPT